MKMVDSLETHQGLGGPALEWEQFWLPVTNIAKILSMGAQEQHIKPCCSFALQLQQLYRRQRKVRSVPCTVRSRYDASSRSEDVLTLPVRNKMIDT